MRALRVVAAPAFLVALVAAAPPAPPAPAPKITVLKAARMFDGRSLVTPGLVVVEGGKIRGIGAKSVDAAGKSAEVIDLGDATLLPGFMDAHTHLTGELQHDWNQMELDYLKKSLPQQALETTTYAKRTLMAGFTTVRDLGAGDDLDIGLRDAIAAGTIPGPRMLIAVRAIGSIGGHCDTTGYRRGVFGRETGPADGVATGEDEMRQAVRLDLKYGADVIKVCATGGVLSLTDDVDSPQFTQEELEALVDEAHAWKRKAAAHAHGATGAKRAIRAGIDSIEHGTFLDDEALDLMRAKGTVLVPTLMTGYSLSKIVEDGRAPPLVVAKAKAASAKQGDVVKRALARGVKIGLGTDAAVYPHGLNAGEFGRLVDLGMKPIDALKAATTVNAELLGIADRLGSLEAGKIADVIALPGDPTKDVRQTEKVFFVMKDGVVHRHDR